MFSYLTSRNAIGRRTQRAQSLVEFALVLPIMLLLLAGGADLARVFFVGIEITDGARQAALYAADNAGTLYDADGGQLSTTSPTTQQQLTFIAAGSAGFLQCPSGDIHVSVPPTTPDQYSGSNALAVDQTVTVVCRLPLLTPLLPSPVTIVSSATGLVIPGPNAATNLVEAGTVSGAGMVTFTFTESNTGNDPITDVSVVSQVAACSPAYTATSLSTDPGGVGQTLQPGVTWTYQCSFAGGAGSTYTDGARATGTDAITLDSVPEEFAAPVTVTVPSS